MSEEVNEKETESEAQADIPVEKESEAENAEVQASEETVPEEESQESELDKAKKRIEKLEAEAADYKDKYLRAVADFQNLRKRSIQEKQEAFDYANTNLLKDLLDSLDNFDRTVEAASSASDPKAIADGVTMINKSMVSMLENKYDLVAYGAVGDAFNPDIHEAIGKSDDPVAEPVLKAVYLKGYKLKDRVIRHAKVMVSMPDGSVKAEDTGDSKAENAEESK